MTDTKLLRKIYRENKEINRNLQQLANLGFLGIFAIMAKEITDEQDETGKKLVKAGLFLVALSDILLMVSKLVDNRKFKKEERRDEIEENS